MIKCLNIYLLSQRKDIPSKIVQIFIIELLTKSKSGQSASGKPNRGAVIFSKINDHINGNFTELDDISSFVHIKFHVPTYNRDSMADMFVVTPKF